VVENLPSMHKALALIASTQIGGKIVKLKIYFYNPNISFLKP
jgi:predicted adenine nucleotide alpha hydrolase (AANH) superfamily ATPase